MSSVTPPQPQTPWHPASATPPPVGNVVAGKYEIEALLGRGGMGAVYRAQHVLTHRRVALKWLLADDASMRMRFVREARAMGALEHPNVVGILDIGEDEGAVYLVMEYVEGESLREHLDRQRVSPARAIALLMPALEGIAAAHQAGIVHRDLKPANLFVCLDRDGTAYGTKVLDFGVALSLRHPDASLGLTQSGAVVGTPRYMAPEQIRAERNIDARADQFALGLILYEMLTGRLPYDAVVYEALVVEIVTVDPPSPRRFAPEVPEGLAEVVLRALAKHPEDRFPDVGALAAALEPYGEGVVFTPPRQAHARRSMLGDEVEDLARASAALTPSRPTREPQRGGAGEEGATRKLRPNESAPTHPGGAAHALAATLDDPALREAATEATRKAGGRAGAPRLEGEQSGERPRAASPREGGATAVSPGARSARWPIGVGVVLVALALAAALGWAGREPGAEIAPPTAPTTRVTDTGGAATDEGALGPSPTAAPSEAPATSTQGAAPGALSTRASDESGGANAASTGASATGDGRAAAAASAGGSTSGLAGAADASGTGTAGADSADTATPPSATATSPDAAGATSTSTTGPGRRRTGRSTSTTTEPATMRAAGRSGAFSVEDF